MSVIIACNAGSDNTKLAAFDAATLERRGRLTAHNMAEVEEWLCSIGSLGIQGVAHRLVHGGDLYHKPVKLDAKVIADLNAMIKLAPLHQPVALRLIEEVQKLYPKVLHVACFDTAFHQNIPAIERWYALPRHYHDEGLKRYGFHGLSYEYIASVLTEKAGEKAKGRVVVAHLGGGSSACAMKNLKSTGGTMGFSTLDGMMMGTRCGALDAGVILYLLQEEKLSTEAMARLLYKESGLKGVSGISEKMSDLLASKAPEAAEAIELYCRYAAREISALLPALGGLDLIVFTGGIGEHAAPVRKRITELLRFTGAFEELVIPTDEEIVLARACQATH
jgi:acetate kinase